MYELPPGPPWMMTTPRFVGSPNVVKVRSVATEAGGPGGGAGGFACAPPLPPGGNGNPGGGADGSPTGVSSGDAEPHAVRSTRARTLWFFIDAENSKARAAAKSCAIARLQNGLAKGLKIGSARDPERIDPIRTERRSA